MTTPGPAGWYDDPQDSKAQRYWDGQDWTGRVKRKPVQRPPVDPPPLPTSSQPAPESYGWEKPRTGSPNTVRLKAIGAIALVCIGGFVAYKLISGNSGGHPQTSGNSSGHQQTSRNSAADQIQQLVQAWTDDFNNEDLAGLKSLMCSGSASQLPRNLFPRHDIKGTLSSSVSNINVTGDRATATVISNWSGGTHERWDNSYGKENGVWKICHTLSF